MPPKKATDESSGTKWLGRPGTNVKMGIVGLPNVGKSTLFNTLSKLNVAAENFPFCTIDPNVARVPVPDKRWDVLVEKHNPASKVPAMLTITDIAGLVKGAAEGAGLGNAFLSHISACDGIYHVLRAFDDVDVVHVEDSVDPIRDMEIINHELVLKDLEMATKQFDELAKVYNRNKTKKPPQYDVWSKALEMLKEGKSIRSGVWKDAEVDYLNELLLLTAKPVIYLVNLSEKDFLRQKNKWLPKIKAYLDEHDPGCKIIPFSGAVESNLVDMGEEEAATWCSENKTRSMLPKIITTGYEGLGLVHYFTCGPDEVRAWTIREQTKAPQAAGVIHTDFEKGFICAEVMSYDDFIECGSEAEAKAAGKYRQQGKTYVVNDGDIVFFKFNAGAGLSKGKK